MKDSSLPAPLAGSVADRRFAIVVSRYHHDITGPLLAGALETLAAENVPDDQIRVAWVPGAWELPLAAKRLIQHDQSSYNAVLCFGCVIKGETTHDLHINSTVSQLLGQMSVEHQLPIGFGLLTCNTMDQAIARSGGAVGNKGVETATAVVEMLKLFDTIGQQPF